ncbi:hypothetical protein [Streptomyces vietnamensis]|uniref:Uncharacterized protein n=1 Tax=Streptomyces vietnamensis TaxID=362257 RepID=A0A0B5I7Y9_9ACTN|nr:hypothetical protein [Streptomyces vietnamensis]AJF66602.1 hypothetical protein SVTN_21740 [Streptomyces vietnamensis]
MSSDTSVLRSAASTQIAIKSVCAIMPGYGAVGEEFGRLVPTAEIVEGIRPGRDKDLPGSFVEDKLGIASVATTHATAAAARAAVDSGLDWDAAAAAIPKPAGNADLWAMLTRAMDIALTRHERASGTGAARATSIAGHLHFAANGDNPTAFAILECRRNAGCHKPGLPGEYMISGCAGLFFALRHAEFLLRHTEARHDPDAYVLITAASDLLPFAHTRGRAPEGHRADLNSWLFQTIFGEGVGAMVVGHADVGQESVGQAGVGRAGVGHAGGDQPGGHWRVEDTGWETVADDWRVSFRSDGGPRMVIRARDVSATFRSSVPDAAREGLRQLGLKEADDLHRLCIHESNPFLVAAAAKDLEAPSGLVHSLSAEVGTLGGVSVFSLLEEAIHTNQPASHARDGIVCALIGETGDAVVAGHLALRHIPHQVSR